MVEAVVKALAKLTRTLPITKPRWLHGDARTEQKITLDYYSNFFNNADRYVEPPVLPFETRHATSSVNRRIPALDKIRPEHQKNLSPIIINTLAPISTCYLSERKIPNQCGTSNTMLLLKKSDLHDIGNYRVISLLSIVNKLVTRVSNPPTNNLVCAPQKNSQTERNKTSILTMMPRYDNKRPWARFEPVITLSGCSFVTHCTT